VVLPVVQAAGGDHVAVGLDGADQLPALRPPADGDAGHEGLGVGARAGLRQVRQPPPVLRVLAGAEHHVDVVRGAPSRRTRRRSSTTTTSNGSTPV
jgi:hypothetical protein